MLGVYSLLWLLLLQSLHLGVNSCAVKCGDGTCVQAAEICDGTKDCVDGADETLELCSTHTCSLSLGLEVDLGFDTFRCDYGACISSNFKCNGISNCADGSDETSETCKDNVCERNLFRCHYGACISRTAVCDGVKQCHDGSDEDPKSCLFKARRRVVCPRRTKKYCDSRTECYDKHEECDGTYDCADKSDEKDELCEGRPPRPTAPPAGSTDSPPPLPPPIGVVNPGSPFVHEGDCLPGYCSCPTPELKNVCLPCFEVADVNTTCLSLNDEAVCSVAVVRGVSVDILHCGNENLISPSTSARQAESCGNRRRVPPMTVAFVDCWNISSSIMRCHSDGYWRLSGARVFKTDDFKSYTYLMDKQPMKRLCQPHFINSQVCGRRPRYRSTGGPLRLEDYYVAKNRWPMVMALKKNTIYSCSATLISSKFLLTAAHCVARSLESRNETMDVRDLKVQLSDRRWEDLRVVAIYLHPEYHPSKERYLNDLALIQLERSLTFHSDLYPACVDLYGEGLLSGMSAVTFDRSNNNNSHKYDKLLQQVDPSCYNALDRCHELQIATTQFCGVDLENKRYLKEGSSGGPFMQNLGSEASEEWAISGVVSYKNKQSSCGMPHTIFTATNSFRQWIAKIVHDEYKATNFLTSDV